MILPGQLRIAKYVELLDGKIAFVNDIDYDGKKNPTGHFAVLLTNKQGEPGGDWTSTEKIKRIIGKNPYNEPKATDLGVAQFGSVIKQINELLNNENLTLKRAGRFMFKHEQGPQSVKSDKYPELGMIEDITSLKPKFYRELKSYLEWLSKEKHLEPSKFYKIKFRNRDIIIVTDNNNKAHIQNIKEVFAGIDEPPKLAELADDADTLAQIDKLKKEVEQMQKAPTTGAYNQQKQIHIKQNKIAKLEKELHSKPELNEMKMFKEIIALNI